MLARDGRMSFTELAKMTGLSVSAAQQRVRRLEQRGVFRGYAAFIDPDHAGLPLAAFIDPDHAGLPLAAFISLKPFDAAAVDDAPERLAHLPAIEACHSVAGDENYILKRGPRRQRRLRICCSRFVPRPTCPPGPPSC
jgi:Lrp/AsnC family leucine-responsive transcriptional regulator